MQKSETLISYEGVKQSFEGKITIFGGRLFGGMRVSLKALQIYVNGVRSKIEALPRVQLVCCRDCKWYAETEDEEGNIYPTCEHPEEGGGWTRGKDWFCADGEPKEDNDGD